MVSCLDNATLTAWVDGALPSTERERALSHIADCGMCREVASALMSAAPAPGLTLIPAGMRPAELARAALPAAGYRLGDAIGRGGMGAVIAAQDLRIGREVALKRMTTIRPTS